jgi:Ricin-type beta-trefoil lectin domain
VSILRDNSLSVRVRNATWGDVLKAIERHTGITTRVWNSITTFNQFVALSVNPFRSKNVRSIEQKEDAMSHLDVIRAWKLQHLAKRVGALLSLALGLGLLPGHAEALYYKQGTKWPNVDIPVCWLPSATTHPSFSSWSRWTREAVDNSWGKVANIRFIGWGSCPAAPKGMVAIGFDNTRSDETSHIGYSSTSASYVNFNQGAADTEEGFKRDAIHEFGHVLGFEHEMDRPGNPYVKPHGCWGTVVPGDDLGTPYDRDSIMDYEVAVGDGTQCRTLLGPRLSPWDIVGVQNLYGRKKPGSVVGLNNRCLDLPDGTLTLGTELQVFNCHGRYNQSWIHGDDGSLRAFLSASSSSVANSDAEGVVGDRCVDVPGGTVSPSSGTILQSNSCTGTSSQRFSFENVELRGIGNKCVDVPSGSYFSGQYVQLYDCQGGANQEWTVEPSGRIKAGSSGYCLEVPTNGEMIAGTLLQLYPCHDGPSQRFTFNGLGEITFGGLCVDSQDAVPSNSVKLQLYICKGDGWSKRNQQWHLSGPICGLGGQCLDIRGGIAADRAKAQLYPCYGGDNQTWDYYFK